MKGVGMDEPSGFAEFVGSRSPALVRTAALLTGDLACGPETSSGPWKAVTVTFTLPSRTLKTFLVRFDGCDQVIGNTGVAVRTSPALRDDLRRLIPSSGL